ncbi:efflux RND transporter permease subunit [Myxococcota bacterium]|nr:efflux RND transporter permease subunit [Myxococcota bacterium]
MKFLANFSVRQPVLMNLMVLFIIFAGFAALKRLPREVFPEVPQGKITITAVYPGVSPQEMESLVAVKIEREIKDISGIKEITTTSMEGMVSIMVEAEEGLPESEVSRIGLDIQAAVGRTQDLPTDMNNPIVKALKIEIPVLFLGIKSALPEMETRIIAKELQDKIEQIDGVSSAFFYGMRNLEISVKVDPDKAGIHHISLAKVMAVIKAHQTDIPGGTIKLEKGEYLIRIMGKVDKTPELKNLIVSSTETGLVRLKDIAEVTMGLEEPIIIGRVGGERSIYMGIMKKMSGDAITISSKVMKLMKEWQATAPDGVQLQNLFDSAKYIKRRQNTMLSNGISGLILVVALLFVFLSFKAALLTALGIPVAFLGSFIIMWKMGITLSMMSMFGLIVALGMIVDDAIVVVENVYRYLMQGLSPKEAAIVGAQEVTWPIIGSVTTTIVAFSTLTMMPGNMGKILGIIPIVVAIALSLSLMEALLVLPSHLAEWLTPPKKFRKDKEGGETAEARWFVAFQNGFVWMLRKVIRIWPVSLAAFVGLFIYSMWFAGSQLEFNPFPAKTIQRIEINMETPVGSKLEHTERVTKIIENAIKKAKPTEVESFWCTVGSMQKGTGSVNGTHYVSCRVNFYEDGNSYPRKPIQMIAEWRKVLSNMADLEGYNLSIGRAGPPSGNPIEVQVRGPEQEKCAELAGMVKEFAIGIPGVTDVNDDVSSGKRELRVEIDQERAALHGIDPLIAGGLVRMAFAGGIASKLQKDDDDINVVVKYPDNRRRSIDEIRNMEIISPLTGKSIPFRSIGTIEEGRGPGRLIRVDQKRTVTVVGDIDVFTTNSARVNAEIKKYTADLTRDNPGYRFVYGGESQRTDEIMGSMLLALWLSLGGIYIILATIFQSFIQPLIVLVAIPFGTIGVVAGLWFHNLPMSMMAGMGFIALMGVVVNDSLVMVDFINSEMARGLPVQKAVIEGGRLRLRAVILTTVTTIFGLLPMGLGIFGSEEFLQPMALTMAWGLGFATLMTLFLVPCIYLLSEKIKGVYKFLMRIFVFWGDREAQQ